MESPLLDEEPWSQDLGKPKCNARRFRLVATAALGISCIAFVGSYWLANNHAVEATASGAQVIESPDLSMLGIWLKHQHNLLKQWAAGDIEKEKKDFVTLVVGNEASDADSIITALTYGFLKAALHERDLLHSNITRVFIPSIKCKRQHMQLKQETLAILTHAGVDPNDLIHMDDYMFAPLMRLIDLEDSSFQVILVDHNEADGLLKGKVNNRVVEILDHHMDQQAHAASVKKIAFDTKSGKPTVLSACSVVAQEYIHAGQLGSDLLAADGGAVASALLAVIIIDSKGMSRASTTDRDVADRLRSVIPNVDAQKHLQFKWLQWKRVNPEFWASATLEENLLYDFKAFSSAGMTCGISATFLNLPTLLSKLRNPAEASALDEYVIDPEHLDPDQEVQSTVFIIMLKRSPKHIAVATKNPALREFSRRYLIGQGGDKLQLDWVEETASNLHAAIGSMDYYSQGKGSRKQVGPICQSMLEAFAK